MEQVQQFLPFILMFVVIYFFMIRPQQKRVKQEKQFESDLKLMFKSHFLLLGFSLYITNIFCLELLIFQP